MQLGIKEPCPALETCRLSKQIEPGKEEPRKVKVTGGVTPFPFSEIGVPIHCIQQFPQKLLCQQHLQQRDGQKSAPHRLHEECMRGLHPEH